MQGSVSSLVTLNNFTQSEMFYFQEHGELEFRRGDVITGMDTNPLLLLDFYEWTVFRDKHLEVSLVPYYRSLVGDEV